MLSPTTSKIKALPIIIIILSFLFLASWVFDIEQLIHISDKDATMKFNTALLFFVCGFISYLKDDLFKHLKNTLLLIVIFICCLNLLEYFNFSIINLDQLFIKDHYTEIAPGRMSPASSFLFLCFSFIIILNKNKKNEPIILLLHGIILIVAYISIMTFFFGLSIDQKSLFLKSFSFQTSILFILLSFSFPLTNNNLIHLFTSKLLGSRLLKHLLPVVILTPFIICKYLIYTKNIVGLENENAIKKYTITIVLVNTIIILILAIKFNILDANKNKIENSLKLSNSKFRSLLEAIDKVNIIEITNNEGIITDINDKFEERSKYSRDEVIGKRYDIINSNFHSKAFFSEMWDKISQGKIWIGDIKNKAKDGTYYWVETAIIPVLDSNEEIQEFISIKRDITDDKEYIKKLNYKYIRQLEKEKRELEQLAYVTSHHLIEPLRIINNFSLILKNETKHSTSDKSLVYLNNISNATVRLEIVVNSLLSFYKIGKKFKRDEFDLNDLITNIEKEYSIKYKLENEFIERAILPKINADRYLIKKLLSELLENAIYYHPFTDKIKIKIDVEENDEYWFFNFIDNGTGIADIDKLRVFSIFQQLGTQSEKKVGLGLAICKKIISLHHGKITIATNEEKGTKVVFSIKKV